MFLKLYSRLFFREVKMDGGLKALSGCDQIWKQNFAPGMRFKRKFLLFNHSNGVNQCGMSLDFLNESEIVLSSYYRNEKNFWGFLSRWNFFLNAWSHFPRGCEAKPGMCCWVLEVGGRSWARRHFVGYEGTKETAHYCQITPFVYSIIWFIYAKLTISWTVFEKFCHKSCIFKKYPDSIC